MFDALKEAENGVISNDGGPFGAVITDKSGNIIAKGHNMVLKNTDPTSHAEIVAIRKACNKLNTIDLSNYILYTTCEPCPMCLGAIYWARFDNVYYGNTKEDAANINFDEQYIYEELDRPLDKRHLPMQQLLRDEAIKVFQKWAEKQDKILY